MEEKAIRLSKRLQMIASMVSYGNRVADIGCDHGYLPIWLVEQGIIPAALAMDVRQGPLEAARKHINARGLGGYISLRCSDGLKEFREGEAETVVCAGMGGRLMGKIIAEGLEKVKTVRELILQPQSELREFRAFLRESDFRILQEDAVREEGKYYFAMRAVYRGGEPAGNGREREGEPGGHGRKAQEDGPGDAGAEAVLLYDMFGEKLLTGRHPVLQEYLVYRRGILRRLSEELSAGNSGRVRKRLGDIGRELYLLDRALAYYR